MEHYAAIKNDFIQDYTTILRDANGILLNKENSLQNVLTVFIYFIINNILMNLHAYRKYRRDIHQKYYQ